MKNYLFVPMLLLLLLLLTLSAVAKEPLKPKHESAVSREDDDGDKPNLRSGLMSGNRYNIDVDLGKLNKKNQDRFSTILRWFPGKLQSRQPTSSEPIGEPTSQPLEKIWSVVIIGGGASGLGAAHRLRSEGIEDVLVLEANSEIGGRARKDTTFGGFPIDLGPSYVFHSFKDELEELTGNKDLPLVRFPGSQRFLGGRRDGYVWRNYTYLDLFVDYFTPPNLEINCWVGAIDYFNYEGDEYDTSRVHCEDGRSFRAQRVIVTVPLSVLKDEDIEFTPRLPREVNRRTSARPWQKGFKIFVEFDRNFYDSRNHFCVAASGFREDRCWSQPGRGEQLLWDFSKFSAPDPENAPHIVAGYFIGERADEFEGLLETEIVERVVDKIGDYWGVNADRAYRNHFLQYWSDDPYIRGTYSGYPDSDGNRNNWVIDVDDKLYFAGEAFPVNGEDQAWVHTAMHSGFKATDKILANPPLLIEGYINAIPKIQPTQAPTLPPTDSPTSATSILSSELSTPNDDFTSDTHSISSDYSGDLLEPALSIVIVDKERFGDSDDGFYFQSDTFKGTNNPWYSIGRRDTSSGVLEVTLGGRDNEEITDGMSGGWIYDFTLLEETTMLTVTFDYELFLTGNYESNEYAEVIVSLDGEENEIVSIDGKGEDHSVITASEKTTFVGVPAGSRALTIGVYNNEKTHGDEFATLWISAISILASTG